jgi:carboxylate-amine ligase
MTTFGIEEEFIFLDRDSLQPVDVAAGVFTRLAATPDWAAVTHREFLAAQVEHASAVLTTLEGAQDALVGFRREVAADAARLGVVAASVGVPPDALPFPTITDQDRYLRIVRDMAGVIADHQICGLHTHVGLSDREDGIRALNASRSWLPLLSAMSGNSPIWRGYDTGYESWRNVEQRRWTTTGCPPIFVDAADYDRRLERLIGIGGMKDRAIIMWMARLSSHVPTIEFRVGDAQLEAWSSVFLASFCRALVVGLIDESLGISHLLQPSSDAAPGPEMLNAALLHSAHSGMSEDVLDPVLGELRPAAETLERSVRLLEPALEANGDLEAVQDGTARLLREGTGAARQRAAFARGGMPALRELYEETFARGD